MWAYVLTYLAIFTVLWILISWLGFAWGVIWILISWLGFAWGIKIAKAEKPHFLVRLALGAFNALVLFAIFLCSIAGLRYFHAKPPYPIHLLAAVGLLLYLLLNSLAVRAVLFKEKVKAFWPWLLSCGLPLLFQAAVYLYLMRRNI